ncbi:MAG: 50S ribosomal protein L24 [Christensenellales bacterium]
MKKLHVKKNDTVVVLSGKDAGKRGKVLSAKPALGKIIVEGVNIITKHVKPRSAQQPGGRIEQAAPIYACKVMTVCPHCDKPTRPAKKISDDGVKFRVCKHCGETF